MSAIQYVVRGAAGDLQHGAVIDSDIDGSLSAAGGKAISLNMRRADVREFVRAGTDLELYLADGRRIVLEDYFNQDGTASGQLFLSEGGVLMEVNVAADGQVTYAEATTWGKWSELDVLTFPDDPIVSTEAYTDGEEVSQAAALGLAPLAGIGAGALPWAAGAAGLAGLGAALLGGENEGGGNFEPGGEYINPTVNESGETYTYNGDSELTLDVSGTAEPGSEVVVQAGDQIQTTTADDDGNWEVTFTGDDFPEDGEHDVRVRIEEPGGAVHQLDGPAVNADTVAPDVEITGLVGVEGDVVNGDEYDTGFRLEGTGEAGAALTVVIDNVTRTTTIADDGTWSITYNSGDLPDGEYTTGISVTATDSYGNSTVISGSLNMDTVAPSIEFGPAEVADDGTVNAEEATSTVEVTGLAEPGAAVVVTMDDYTFETVATAQGTWSVQIPAGAFGDGEYEATMTAVATDAAGNSTTTTSTITVDTIGTVTLTETQTTVNENNFGEPVTLTGTVEAGSTVTVSYKGTDYPAVVTGTTWSLDIPASAIQGGEYTTNIAVRATDAAGNESITRGTLVVDTETTASIAPGYAGDEIINETEAGNGVSFTGTGEPGAAFTVEFEGATKSGTVGANGSWDVTFAPGEIPSGEYTSTMTLTATDALGNTAVVTEDVTVDTETSITANVPAMGQGDLYINNDEMSAGVQLTGTAEAGSTVNVKIGQTSVDVVAGNNGTWVASFPVGSIAPGEYEATVTSTSEDAAGNTATTTDTIKIDTLVTDFAFIGTPGTSDGVLSASELSQGLTISGTVEDGATVSVTIAGVTKPASLNANGTWDVTFPAGTFPAGEYQTTLTVTAQDAAHNTSSLTEMIQIDTVAGDLALSPAAIEIDDIVNGTEILDGVTISGTATPGMLVTVNLGDATGYVVAANNGTWSYDFPANEVPSGTYTADISASITDQYGNTKEVFDTVDVDTEVENFAISSPVAGDDIISGSEAGRGVTIEGTAEANSELVVTFGNHSETVVSDSRGNWEASFASYEVPTGEQDVTISVKATDEAGNVATRTHDVEVDTYVNELELDGPVSGDGYINAAEAASGVELTGTVEVGSEVWVTLGGTRTQANVDGNGDWSVTFTSGEIGTGERDLDITVEAEDEAGNTASLTDHVTLDTEAPDAAYITSYTRGGSNLRSFSVEMQDATAILTTVDANGVEGTIDHDQEDSSWGGVAEVDFDMNEPVSDGDHLVVTKSDDAGNTSSTLFAMEGTSDQLVLDGIASGDINFEAIDLRFAEDTVLEINVETLEELSVNSNILTIHGSADDTVEIDRSAITQLNETVTIDGENYDVYSYGDEGGRLIIDDEINVI